jgi:hypothetical protein
VTIHAATCTTRSTRSNRSIGWVPFALVALFGTSERTTDLCLGAGWVINLAVAEYVIRRSAGRRAIIGRPTINSRSIRATAKVGSS